jgi:hypothetical protein
MTVTYTQERQSVQDEARFYLDSTDWYVIRFIETGVPVPEEITEARAAARLLIN